MRGSKRPLSGKLSWFDGQKHKLINQETVEALGTIFPAWCTSMYHVVLHNKTELTQQSVEVGFRDEDGILHTHQKFRTEEIPQM
jgi:hypothetical protein